MRISQETAKLALEKGVVIPSTYFYLGEHGLCWWGEEVLHTQYSGGLYDCNYGLDQREDKYYAPTQAELQKQLRDKNLIDVYALPVRFTGYGEIGYYTYAIKGIQPIKNYKFGTWEEALEVGLIEGLKLINNIMGNSISKMYDNMEYYENLCKKYNETYKDIDDTHFKWIVDFDRGKTTKSFEEFKKDKELNDLSWNIKCKEEDLKSLKDLIEKMKENLKRLKHENTLST